MRKNREEIEKVCLRGVYFLCKIKRGCNCNMDAIKKNIQKNSNLNLEIRSEKKSVLKETHDFN